jgi:Bacterial regulatory protein, Fis family
VGKKNQFRDLTAADYQAAIDAVKEHDGNITHAAQALGIKRETFRERVHRAAALGLMGSDPVLPGFAIKNVSTEFDENGAKGKEWIKQRQLGEEFKLPDGHVIKGISALTDPDGRIIQQWVKTKFDEAVENVKEGLIETFKAYKGHATLPKAPRHADRDLTTVYPISDHHLGLYAWAEEAGENYDLNIGRKLLMNSMAALVADAPRAKTGLILSLGDFFHSEDNTNRTRKSGAVLDVDGRHAKILRVGVELIIHCIQLALQRHEHVIVRCLPGNHDEYASLALSTALGAFFSNSKRVTIDTDASRFFKYRFDKVLLTSTHGDMVAPSEMPGMIAATWPEDWGTTKFRYCYLGHVHHKSIGGGEKAGVIWETFQTLAPKDVWHKNSGYTSGRSMVSITHHRERGEWKRHTVSVKGPQ